MFRATGNGTQMPMQVTVTADETAALGRHLSASLRGGDIVLLYGPLGAGKSVFARGLAEGLGAGRWRGSPTFTLIHEYSTQPPLYHLDLYRISAGEVSDLGLEEYARSDAVMVVEWADRAAEQLRALGQRVVEVEIDHAGEDRREIRIHGAASRMPGAC
jgi:tRNA threonylcarbamoyladenosine biosynthesis protein TsaE